MAGFALRAGSNIDNAAAMFSDKYPCVSSDWIPGDTPQVLRNELFHRGWITMFASVKVIDRLAHIVEILLQSDVALTPTSVTMTLIGAREATANQEDEQHRKS